MSILKPEEFELALYEAINECYKNQRGLLVVDFFKLMIKYFNSNYSAYLSFLAPLTQKGYITYGSGKPNDLIDFGVNASEWRERMDHLFPASAPSIANQTLNISHANQVQAAGRDINNFNQNDAQHLIDILKQVIPDNPEPNSLSKKVRSWLDCGASAIDILKGIASLI